MLVTYKIQLYPSEPIEAYVRERKSQILEQFGQYRFYTSHPHISFFYFQADNSQEHLIGKALRQATVFVSPFDVTLNGFSYFRPGRTIFLKLENAFLVANRKNLFYQKFKELAVKFGVELIAPRNPDIPHMTIGSDFDQRAFLALHEKFMSKHYRESFYADHVCFLRDLGNGKNEPIEKIYFNEKTAITLQWPEETVSEETVSMVEEPQMSLFYHVA